MSVQFPHHPIHRGLRNLRGGTFTRLGRTPRSRLSRMQPDNRPPGASEWRIREVAAHLGIAESTVHAYRARKQMPAEDGRDRYGPWWHPDTITAWAANRPGPGNRSSRRGHRARNTGAESSTHDL